jgi:predicted anti-sigma-YlaC factor YlaD
MHATREELALYVMGALDGARSGAVEDHVAQCGACAEALADEARVELALGEIARRAEASSPAIVVPVAGLRAARARRDLAGGVAGALAAAAAIVLALASSTGGRTDLGASAAYGRSHDAATIPEIGAPSAAEALAESGFEPVDSDKLDGG